MNLSKDKPVDPEYSQYLDTMGSDTSLMRAKDGPVLTQYFRSCNLQEGYREHARVLFARHAKGSQSVVVGTLSSDDSLPPFQTNIILTPHALHDFIGALLKLLPIDERQPETPIAAGEEGKS